MDKMTSRPEYLEAIRPFIDKALVKVLTGIRRSGKSALLSLLRDELRTRHGKDCQIIYLNFESFQWAPLRDASALHAHILAQTKPGGRSYLLFDEIQEVAGWEMVINSLLVDIDCDIYLTGSNSRLLSGELATYLAGRYIEFGIQTLSFTEALTFQAHYRPQIAVDKMADFQRFMRIGGFPLLHTGDFTPEEAWSIISDIHSSVILRDIVQRHAIRNIDLLERVTAYVFDNVGNIFSAKKVADYFKSQQRKVDLETVYQYLRFLEQAFIIHRVGRYDIKGKAHLSINEKYYLADQGLKSAHGGWRERDVGTTLENIVYLELRRRGYQVFVGIFGEREIDFVALRQTEKLYIQVAWRLSEESTIVREFGAFDGIPDHYPKYVVTTEENWQDNIEGVRHVNIVDFLCRVEW